jgi:chemotaxis protein MotB
MRKNLIDNEESSVDNFYISWGDLVSLLLVFFVYLFSISEIDIVKFLEAKQSMRNEMVEIAIEDVALKRVKLERKKLAEMKRKIEEFIMEESLQDVFSVEYIEDRLELNMGNAILFESGSADLKIRAQEILSKVGKLFVTSDSKIIIEGHTDDIPIKNDIYPSNWELSSARASSVVRYISSLGVPQQRFQAIGYNQYKPLVPNITMNNRAKNRRVKITLKPDIEHLVRPTVISEKNKTNT